MEGDNRQAWTRSMVVANTVGTIAGTIAGAILGLAAILISLVALLR